MMLFFALLNLVIVFGYLFVAFFVMPYMDIRKWTKIWGALFFLTCALTHIELATHAYLNEPFGFLAGHVDWHMWLVHIPQAFSVWGFVTGLYREFVIPKATGR